MLGPRLPSLTIISKDVILMETCQVHWVTRPAGKRCDLCVRDMEAGLGLRPFDFTANDAQRAIREAERIIRGEK